MRISRYLVAAVVLVAVVAPVSHVSAAPKPNDRCQKAGRQLVTATGTLRCQSVGGVLRWRRAESPTATSTSTTTTSTTLALTCADGGPCKVGDIGPGGGQVFYVSLSPFASPGSDCASTCFYLEVAPPGGDTQIGTTRQNQPVYRTWATGAQNNQAVPGGATSTAIGSGMSNTIAIQAQPGNTAATSAAVYAFEYVNGGKTDWHLPSKDELNELITSQFYLRIQESRLALEGYWSSSESNANLAWRSYGIGDRWRAVTKFDTRIDVRPVRAF